MRGVRGRGGGGAVRPWLKWDQIAKNDMVAM